MHGQKRLKFLRTTNIGHLLIGRRLPSLFICVLLSWWETSENKHFLIISGLIQAGRNIIIVWEIMSVHSYIIVYGNRDWCMYQSLLTPIHHTCWLFSWEWWHLQAGQSDISYSWNCTWVIRKTHGIFYCTSLAPKFLGRKPDRACVGPPQTGHLLLG